MNTTLAGEACATAVIAPEPAPASDATPVTSGAGAGALSGRAVSRISALPALAAQPRDWLSWLAGCLESRRLLRAGYAVLLLEIAVVAGFALVYRPFDLEIYLWGGRAVTDGVHLYLVQSHGNWFTYPPFAAVLFTPLDAIPSVIVRLLWELASVAAVAWACVLTLRLAGYRPGKPVMAILTAAALPLEPVYHTLYLGQINLFLLAIVLTDVWRAARGRPAGIGIGIAAAVKLTPGIFIVLLLLTRRTRDAVTAVMTFACCGIIGFVVDPGASRLYWTHLFYDTTRVGAAYISNQSPYAAAVRILGGVSHVGAWYDVVPVVLGGAGLAVAATLARRGDWLAAVAATGITGVLVSPISWTHHWVWVLPAFVVLLRGGPRSRAAAAGGYVIFVLAPMWWTPHSGTAGDYGAHGFVTFVANCFLVGGLAFMLYVFARAWRLRSGDRTVPPRSGVTEDDSGGPVAREAPASEWT